jgi:DNA-binding CsgD family transcriptional regulator
MVDRTSTRSAGYQHVIVELCCDPETLAERSDAQGITGMLNSNIHSEELLDLQDQLLNEFWRIVYTQLTERQSEVLKLYAKGLTQIEIAKRLGVNQSSITKSINGNCDYRNGRKIYGGAKKRLQKIASKDPVIQQIFERIREIEQDQW